MNALWELLIYILSFQVVRGLVAYIVFTQIVLIILLIWNDGIRKEWKEHGFKLHVEALKYWVFMTFGAKRYSIIASLIVWFVLFKWTSDQSTVAVVTFGVLTLLAPVVLVFRCIWCCYKSQTCPPPP